MSDPLKSFNAKKLGLGDHFKSGKDWVKRYGLHGALRELKDPKYGSQFDNLSSQDVDLFEDILANKLKSKYRYAKGFNRYDRLELIHDFEELYLAGKITREDIADFMKIIDQLMA